MIFILAKKCKARSDTASLKMEKESENYAHSVASAWTKMAIIYRKGT